MEHVLIEKLKSEAKTKIVLLVLDGLGGLPCNGQRETELEAAATPNMDALAASSICGLHQMAPGITPGSGPGHLGLFGYDPLKYQIGRGVLSALGIDFDLRPGDVAARGNFCTVDEAGRVTDRRAGRISTDKNHELVAILNQIELPDAEVIVQTIKEHRFLLVLRGEGLAADVADTDPQATGVKPEKPEAQTDAARKTSDMVRAFLDQAAQRLKDQHPANMVLLRGFASLPDWPSMAQSYGLKGIAIAAYPMYRGVAKLLGMDVAESPDNIEEEFDLLKQHWSDYDFFFVHVKQVDSSGEDGDYQRKIRIIENVDTHLLPIMDLQPDVLLITGDHSTPAAMQSHSWHPVPVLLHAATCRPDNVREFGEQACISGGLGPRLPSVDLMPLALAHAGRLEKFGA